MNCVPSDRAAHDRRVAPDVTGMSATRVHRAQTAPRLGRRAIVTMGMFDGMHRAHQQLVGSTVRLAHRLRGLSVAITFDPDPHVVVNRARMQPSLMPLDARLAHLAALGIDVIWVIPFTRPFSRMTAEQFVRRVLVRRLHAAVLVVGEQFMFGRNRRGDLTVLRAVSAAHGLAVRPIREIRLGGAAISSSRIRTMLAAGRLAEAARLLGRPPVLYGVVERGAGRGRRLGFPTANLRLTSQVLPPQGVYAVMVHLRHEGRARPGVMNLGSRPTFGDGPLTCEVHLPSFSGSLLGQSISVSLLGWLRHERCFATLQELTRHIRRDLIRARRAKICRDTGAEQRIQKAGLGSGEVGERRQHGIDAGDRGHGERIAESRSHI